MGKNVCVVVLGDIGRSPRMQYHSISLAESGHKVDIVGYRGATPVPTLTSMPLVSFHYLNEYPSLYLPRLINYVLKTIWQLISLLFVFIIIRKPDYILVQNPPAVPTLVACYIFKLWSKAKLIIDWHNYAYTIMGLSVGPQHILVKITKWLEKHLGQKADNNFCVTKEMQLDLEGAWNIKAITLYDKPPAMFQSINLKQKHELLLKLQDKYTAIKPEDPNETLFTRQLNQNEYHNKEDRPALLVSSTSWTEDEDFNILLKSLQAFEDHCNSGNIKKLPKLVCVITGSGSLKNYYKEIIAKLGWKHVTVITPWLEASDYPLMLASADLGVSLHTSSSGLDLPMKVVDMFGCGLPVCAHNFKCLHELVQHNKNSYVFNSSEELTIEILSWFENFPHNSTQAAKMNEFKAELQTFQNLRWSENWQMIAAPQFK